MSRGDTFNILHLLAPARVGGLETVIQHLSGAQASAGHRVRVATIGSELAQVELFLSGISNSVEAIFMEIPDRGYLRERRRVSELCREWTPDILHTHGYRPDVLDAGVARALGVPTVSTVHGFTGHDAKNRVYEWLQRRALRQFDAVVAVSQPLARELARSGVPEERLHTVRNELPTSEAPREPPAARRALGVPLEPFHVGWVGRLGPEKGPDVLLNALVHIRDLSMVASVVGEGRMKEELEKQAVSLGVANLLHWHGRVPKAARFFRAFDVFVLSSRTEGTPMVLFEAMAAEVPIVATEVGGVPDVVTSRTGILVPPDDPDALAGAIRRVHDQPGAARKRAQAARRELEAARHSAAWVERYDEVYRAAMDRAQSGRTGTT